MLVLGLMLRAEKGKVRDLNRDLTSAKSESVLLARDKEALELSAKTLGEVAEAAAKAHIRIATPVAEKPVALEKDAPAAFNGVLVSKQWASAATECLKNEGHDSILMAQLRRDSSAYKRERNQARSSRNVWRATTIGGGLLVGAVIIIKSLN